MRHFKKCWPEYFQKIMDGTKRFEVRLADWQCAPGDELVLQEWDPATKQYTGRELVKLVDYVLTTKQLEEWNAWHKADADKFGFQFSTWK